MPGSDSNVDAGRKHGGGGGGAKLEISLISRHSGGKNLIKKYPAMVVCSSSVRDNKCKSYLGLDEKKMSNLKQKLLPDVHWSPEIFRWDCIWARKCPSQFLQTFSGTFPAGRLLYCYKHVRVSPFENTDGNNTNISGGTTSAIHVEDADYDVRLENNIWEFLMTRPDNDVKCFCS